MLLCSLNTFHQVYPFEMGLHTPLLNRLANICSSIISTILHSYQYLCSVMCIGVPRDEARIEVIWGHHCCNGVSLYNRIVIYWFR